MVLLDSIVKVGTLSNADGLQITLRSSLEPVYGIARQDCFAVGLTAIDHNPLGTAVAPERLAQEPLGSSQVALLAEPELDGVAVAIDGTVEVAPLATYLNICLVDMSLGGDGSLSPIEPLQQLGRVTYDPAMHRGMVDGDPSLSHHLFQTPETEIVGQIPPHAEQDD
jgi:hypothetical protein